MSTHFRDGTLIVILLRRGRVELKPVTCCHTLEHNRRERIDSLVHERKANGKYEKRAREQIFGIMRICSSCSLGIQTW